MDIDFCDFRGGCPHPFVCKCGWLTFQMSLLSQLKPVTGKRVGGATIWRHPTQVGRCWSQLCSFYANLKLLNCNGILHFLINVLNLLHDKAFLFSLHILGVLLLDSQALVALALSPLEKQISPPAWPLNPMEFKQAHVISITWDSLFLVRGEFLFGVFVVKRYIRTPFLSGLH